MMFQRTLGAAATLSNDSRTTTSNMNQAQMEDGFDRLRRQQDARKNRSTASCGLFYRKSRVYRHV